MSKWYDVTAKSDKISSLKIHGIIGGGFFEDGVTAEQVEEDLAEIKSIKADVINIDLSSLGGSVMHGLAIYDMLKSSGAKINIDITGFTASMGSIIAMASDKGSLRMSENAQILFHEARSVALGTAETLENEALMLRHINSQFIDIISRKSSMSKDDAKMLLAKNKAEGVFMLPKEAKKKGLIDSIYRPENRMAAAVTIEQLAKYHIKASINQTNNKMKIDLIKVKDITLQAVKAGWDKLTGEDKNASEEQLKSVVDASVEAMTEELQSQFDVVEAKKDASITELESKISQLEAAPNNPRGTDANVSGDNKVLSDSDKAAKEFIAQLSDMDKAMLTTKEDK